MVDVRRRSRAEKKRGKEGEGSKESRQEGCEKWKMERRKMEGKVEGKEKEERRGE